MADFWRKSRNLLSANKATRGSLTSEFQALQHQLSTRWNWQWRFQQRIGRIDRIGQQEEKILVPQSSLVEEARSTLE
jgi:hypothetical protein